MAQEARGGNGSIDRHDLPVKATQVSFFLQPRTKNTMSEMVRKYWLSARSSQSHHAELENRPPVTRLPHRDDLSLIDHGRVLSYTD